MIHYTSMKNFRILLIAFLISSFAALQAQDTETQEDVPQKGHFNENKFRQMYDLLATPNQYRTGSGAPGEAYYQNQADYKMDIDLDDKTQILRGVQTITYHNNSPDALEYLWVQLDQNIRTKDSPALQKDGNSLAPVMQPSSFVTNYMEEPFDGGFNIEEVSKDGKPLPYIVNFTMMRIDLPRALKSGESYSFKIKWWYQVNNHVKDRARSGFEHFPEDGNNVYVIAQFFPRMAVYNDVEGWQNLQFWGDGEFALPFGNYEVNITVPADHILDGTGVITNRKEVYSAEMMKRFEQAKRSFDKPVIIVSQEEAAQTEKGFSEKKKTWKLKAEMVRDFAFATSRKFVVDMMNVDVMGKEVMAISMYPKEGNPLWEDYSTIAVASTLKTYSNHTFQYPYHKAISVHAKNQGMEYPMICWNYGRPETDGTYSEGVKYGMISVIIHEIGHNYFPMIVNGDERQWGWMDEGLNTFLQYLAEQDFGKTYPDAIAPNDVYPSRRGIPSKIVPYMKGDQRFIAPIMSNPENVFQLGNNAYGKPATALNILRETVMGHELFDHAFRTYSQRWMFKHPTPEDFFRTMEDASAVDLDWFWRGWFYSTDNVDIGIKNVRKFYVTDKATKEGAAFLENYNIKDPSAIQAVFVVEDNSAEFNNDTKGRTPLENSPQLNAYVMDNFTAEERANLKSPKYFYQLSFNKPGGLVMPVIVEYTYADGSSEIVRYPVQVWRKNDLEFNKVVATEKEIVKIVVDPKQETADVNTDNNTWPQEEKEDKFQQMKEASGN